MFRRSISEFSYRRSIRRIPKRYASQPMPSLFSLRKEFSTSPQQNASPKVGSSGKSNLPKIVMGSTLIAGAGLLAYQSGYLDQYLGEKKQKSVKVGVDREDVKENQFLGEPVVLPVSEESGIEQKTEKLETQIDLPRLEVEQKVENEMDRPKFEVEQNVETQIDFPHAKTEQDTDTHGDIPRVEVEERVKLQTDIHPREISSEKPVENPSFTQEISPVAKEDDSITVQEKQEQEFFQYREAEQTVGTEKSESKITGETAEVVQVSQVPTQVRVANEDKMKEVPSQELTTENRSKAASVKDKEAASLLDSYHLKERAEESIATESPGDEAYVSAIEELNDGYVTKDGKLVMSFLEAIHAAEKRQAELDAHTFAEEKRALKEKYEKELKDLKARELMRAEEAAMLDKEMKRERAKAAAAIRTLQEKMEEKLRMELEQKESEADIKIKKLQEQTKAELTAAIANEKAAQIEKMAEANLNINALCMAFYARSEEARQIHSVHKLALGTLALEDALSKGLPIQQELDTLNTYLEGIDKDSLIHLVISTLPEETRYHGTDTPQQLNQKFNVLKGTLRHYILIPPGGGGILAHAMAHIASWLRFKEVDPSGDGIESVLSKVENFLAEGKLAEAATALQDGLRDSEAERIAGDWVRRARNRAITEQALTVLKSYAACISLMQ